MTRRSTAVYLGVALLVGVVLAVADAVLVSQDAESDGDAATLSAEWVSDTGRNVTGNHHVAVGGVVDGQPLVFAPVSGEAHDRGTGAGHEHSHRNPAGSENATVGENGGNAASACGLVALDGTSGERRWTYAVSPSNCTIHSVVDPTSGDVLATYERETPVWTSPTLADADGNGDTEILVMYGDGRVAALSYDAGSA